MKQGDKKYALEARAKINLFLEIVGKRNDGYHDILSVFQEISLSDRLEAFPADGGMISLETDMEALPCDESNLVMRAARRLREEAGIAEGIAFRLQKRIPIGGGLGGGSSDAAAALRLACRVWNIEEEQDVLLRIAAELGSDVPFFIQGGTCLCEGRGERVTPLPECPPLTLRLVLPPWSVNTTAAYRAMQGRKGGTRSVSGFLDALAKNDSVRLLEESFNRFEEIMDAVEPRQSRLHAALEQCAGVTWRMSGSGSSVWCAETGTDDARSLDMCLSGMDRMRVEPITVLGTI